MKIKLSLLMILLVSVLYFKPYESDYEKLMKPIREIKLNEQTSGKSSPVFDGISEPGFPSDEQIFEGLIGFDSNGDRVRDDIEIWINRVAEDKYVRIALKRTAIDILDLHLSAHAGDNEDAFNNKHRASIVSLHCLSHVLMPYTRVANSKRIIHKERTYYDQLYLLLFNTHSRKKMIDSVESFRTSKSFSEGISSKDLKNCDSQIEQSYIKEISKKFSTDWSKK